MAYSYEEFPDQVLSAFQPLNEKYDLKVVEIREDHLVIIGNEKLVFELGCEYGYLVVEIRLMNRKKKFHVTDLVKFLNPGNLTRESIPIFGSLKALEWYASIIDTYLNEVITGTDWWYHPLRRREEFDHAIFVLVDLVLDKNHPLKIKMDNRDWSWEKEGAELFWSDKDLRDKVMERINPEKRPKKVFKRTFSNRISD